MVALPAVGLLTCLSVPTDLLWVQRDCYREAAVQTQTVTLVPVGA